MKTRPKFLNNDSSLGSSIDSEEVLHHFIQIGKEIGRLLAQLGNTDGDDRMSKKVAKIEMITQGVLILRISCCLSIKWGSTSPIFP